MSPASTELFRLSVERIVSWPVAVLVLCLAFRKQIADLLRRITSVRAPGINVNAPIPTAASQLAAASATEVKGVDATLAPRRDSSVPPSPPPGPGSPRNEARISALKHLGEPSDVVPQQVAAMRTEVLSTGLDPGSEEAFEIVLRNLAVMNIAYNYELRYRLIFGSQVRALRVLKSTGSQNIETLRPIYDSAKEADPAFYANFTFEEWCAFLADQNMVTIVENLGIITDFAKEFLVYIDQLKLPPKNH